MPSQIERLELRARQLHRLRQLPPWPSRTSWYKTVGARARVWNADGAVQVAPVMIRIITGFTRQSLPRHCLIDQGR